MRLLTPELLARLQEADERYAREGRTGPLVVEWHYGSGKPTKAKVKEDSEIRLTTSS